MEFEVHGFPCYIAIEFVVFLWEYVWFESEFAYGVDEISSVESGVESKAVAVDHFDEFVPGTNFVLVCRECLHDFSGIDNTCQ